MGETGRDLARRIAQAYVWRGRLGAPTVETPHARFLVDPARPQVWEANLAFDVTASAHAEIDAVLADMELRFAHARAKVVHADAATPEPFLARLAFEGFSEWSLIVQMVLEGAPPSLAAPDLRVVETAQDWATLEALALVNHREGLTTGGAALAPEVSAGLVEVFRRKAPACRFHLLFEAGAPVGYASSAAAPNGLGVIDDVFVIASHRGRGRGGAMVATLARWLHEGGCTATFVGALSDERAKRLYARLGFRPVALARTLVKEGR